MSFSVGIVGLPNVGKSTLFKALTRKPVDIASYPFTTINPNVGIVTVPDERLKKIAEIISPEKVTPTVIEFVDIAGLVKGAHKGEGLGNQFLAQIRNCDAVLEVVRDFENPNVEHITGLVNPKQDIETIKIELSMKDFEVLENLISKPEKDNKAADKKLEVLKKIKEELSQGKLISDINLTDEEKLEIKEYQFLTEKPIVFVFNIDNKNSKVSEEKSSRIIFLNLKLEEEISELSLEEKKELEMEPQLDQVILACYNILDLITFFTVAGGKEVRAWTIKKGSRTPQAGGVVHSDFEEKFIRAEVIGWKKLAETASWSKAREMGLIKTVGKDYLVQDGEVIEFRI